MRQDPGAGLPDHCLVSARMVAVFVRVQDLGDIPALFLRRIEALLMIQGVDGQGLAGVAAGDEVVEIAVRVAGPDLFDDHGSIPRP
jgi:hypothetical protein